MPEIKLSDCRAYLRLLEKKYRRKWQKCDCGRGSKGCNRCRVWYLKAIKMGEAENNIYMFQQLGGK